VLCEAHRIHACTWITIYMLLDIPTAILSAIAGASALSQRPDSALFAGLLALLVSVLTSVTTFLNPGQIAQAHKTASSAYRTAQGRFRLFLLNAVTLDNQASAKDELTHLVEAWMTITDLEKDIHISTSLERKARKAVMERMDGVATHQAHQSA